MPASLAQRSSAGGRQCQISTLKPRSSNPGAHCRRHYKQRRLACSCCLWKKNEQCCQQKRLILAELAEPAKATRQCKQRLKMSWTLSWAKLLCSWSMIRSACCAVLCCVALRCAVMRCTFSNPAAATYSVHKVAMSGEERLYVQKLSNMSTSWSLKPYLY